MNITWGIPDSVQIVYVRQPDGRYRVNIAGIDCRVAVITRAELLGFLPNVSVKASIGCDTISGTKSVALFSGQAVAV